MEKVLALIERNNQYIAGVFTSNGLYASSSPCYSELDAVKEVNGASLSREDTEEKTAILETIYAVYEGSKDALVEDIKLDLSGFTPKQVLVLTTVMGIPYGSTMSYGEVARKAGLPGAARFVGNVMRINRLSPIIPCHRVVSSNGLGGYTGGIDKKIDLLAREGVIRGDFSQKALQRML